MAKQNKSTARSKKSKVVVGRDPRQDAKRLLKLAVVGLVIIVAGYFGLKYLSNRAFEAKANSYRWTPLSTISVTYPDRVTAYAHLGACKIPITGGGYGPVWAVYSRVSSALRQYAYSTVKITRNGAIIDASAVSANTGTTYLRTMYGSQIFNDTITYRLSTITGTGGYATRQISSLNTC